MVYGRFFIVYGQLFRAMVDGRPSMVVSLLPPPPHQFAGLRKTPGSIPRR